MKSPSRRQNNC